MNTAYRLRARQSKGLEMRHMGSFIGHLLIRSADRAERVYAAMKCRGYPNRQGGNRTGPFRLRDFVFLFGVTGMIVLLRVFDVPAVLAVCCGRWL